MTEVPEEILIVSGRRGPYTRFRCPWCDGEIWTFEQMDPPTFRPRDGQELTQVVVTTRLLHTNPITSNCMTIAQWIAEGLQQEATDRLRAIVRSITDFPKGPTR